MLLSSILDEIESFDTIRAVLEWTRSQSPPAEVVDAIAQDEDTHDILVRLGPCDFVSFDVSCRGHVRSAAYWNHLPTPKDLLTRRISQGWRPTPTATKTGDVILGYAAVLDGAWA